MPFIEETPERSMVDPEGLGSRVESFADTVRDKSWFAEDDAVVADHKGRGLWWITETYIAYGQLMNAMKDEDVIVGDIEKDRRNGFRVALLREDVHGSNNGKVE